MAALLGAVANAPGVADDNGGLLGAGHAGIKQVSVMHEAVGLVDDDQRAEELRALGLVDGQGVGQLDRALGGDPGVPWGVSSLSHRYRGSPTGTFTPSSVPVKLPVAPLPLVRETFAGAR